MTNNNKSMIFWIGSLVSGLLVLLSSFTPIFVAKGYRSLSVSLMGDATALGIFVLIIAGVAILCAGLKKYIPSLVMGCIASVIFFIIAVADDIVKQGGGRYLYDNGIAYWFLLFGFIGLITFSILCIVDNNKKKAMMYGPAGQYGYNQQYAPNGGYQGQYGGQQQYNRVPPAQNNQYQNQQYAPAGDNEGNFDPYTGEPRRRRRPTSDENQSGNEWQ